MAQIAGVIIRNNKAYLCVDAQTEAGFYFGIEPVFISNLNVEEFTTAFQKVIAFGHPKIPTPTVEEMKKRRDPILAAAGVKSWKALAQNGASYTISWRENSITLYMSRLDKKGRFETDPGKTRTFSKETPLQTIVEVILADAQSRPELNIYCDKR